MDVWDVAVAVAAVLVGFAGGYAFRGWFARRHADANPALSAPAPDGPREP